MTMEQIHYFALAISESHAHEHSDEGLEHKDAVKLRKSQRCLHDWLEETVREENGGS